MLGVLVVVVGASRLDAVFIYVLLMVVVVGGG